MELTYTDQYANIGPTPEAVAYFNSLPDVIKAQILAQGAPSSLDALKKMADEANDMV